MTFSFGWNSDRYLKHIYDNKLDHIWTGYCNPKSVNGIRLSAYTPLYPEDDNLMRFEKQCRRKGCSGTWVIPVEDKIRRVIYKIRCNGTVNGSSCGGYNTVVYRWVSKNDRTKLHFESPKMVEVYGKLGRAFYATSLIYSKEIVGPKKMYVDETLAKACTLTIDCDIKIGNICSEKNKENLGLTLNLLREQLDTFVPGSYNISTSGNGAYIELSHLLCTEHIFETMAMFNAWIGHMNDVIKHNGVTGIKLDPINMPSRVFKLIGSIHQTLDLVSTPLEYDCDFVKVDSEQFKLKNWDINKYINSETGKLNYYNRYDEKDKESLRKFLNEFTEKVLGKGTGPHKIKYNFRVPASAITGEEQELDKVEDEDLDKDLDKVEYMYDEYVGWHNIETPYGSGKYRKSAVGYEFDFDMKEEDVMKIVEEVMEKESKKEI